MRQRIEYLILLGLIAPCLAAADLSTAPSAQLLQTYTQLRALQGSDRGAEAANVVLKRDAATFKFISGRLTFAAPVAGHVVAAVFRGDGVFVINPPTEMDRHQLGRFMGKSEFVDRFHDAVFFFTDDTWSQIQKLVQIKGGADAGGASAALAKTQEKFEKNFNGWWANQRAGNFPMRNLPARMLADLSDPSSQGLFLADFTGDHSGNLLFQISWNRPSLVLPGFASGDEVMLIHYKLNQYSEWWSGFHLAREYASDPHPDHSSLYLHCSHETIDADIAKNDRLSAEATLQFEIERGSPRVLPFNLEGVLRIDSITDGQGNKVAFIQEPRELDSDPWMILPSAPQPNQTFTAKISYSEDSTHDSRIIFQRGSGLYYVTARESWYPSFGAFDDRTDFDLRFQSPKRFKFVATGDETEVKKEKDGLVTEWKSPIPLSVVGFNYGDFVGSEQGKSGLTVTAYSGREVPDVLKNLTAVLNEAQLAAGPGAGDVAANNGIMTGGFNTAENVKNAAAISYEAFRLFQFYYGALPFKNISVTEQPVMGYAQSWPMLIFLPFDSLLDSTTLNSLGLYQSAEAREFYNVVAVHEMSHQWWGHLVGWKTYHDQWMSEGFAEFSAALYIKQFEPNKRKGFWDLERKWLLSKDRAGHRPVDVGPVWLNYQTAAYEEPEVPTDLIYKKGAYVLEMIRMLMEDPRSKTPDARFIAMMHDFTKTYAGHNASTEDFQRIVEKHLGHPMDWFFNEWVYGTETPHYDLQYQLGDAAGGKTLLTFTVSQSEVSPSFLMEVPLYVERNKQMIRLGLVRLRGASSESNKVLLPFRPSKVVLDANHSILCTIQQ